MPSFSQLSIEKIERWSNRHWVCINLRDGVAWMGQAFAHPDIRFFSARPDPAGGRLRRTIVPWQDTGGEHEQ
jgi:hypothetical protein